MPSWGRPAGRGWYLSLVWLGHLFGEGFYTPHRPGHLFGATIYPPVGAGPLFGATIYGPWNQVRRSNLP